MADLTDAEIRERLNHGANVNAQDNHGRTALMRACTTGDFKRVKALIAEEADLNVRDEKGISPLISACDCPAKYEKCGANVTDCHLEVVNALLEAGADVDAKDEDGDTALMCASSKGHLEVVKALLAAGADVNAKDEDGRTALIRASGSGHLEVVKALLAAGREKSKVPQGQKDTGKKEDRNGIRIEEEYCGGMWYTCVVDKGRKQ